MNEKGTPDEYIANGTIEQDDEKLKDISFIEKYEGEKIFTKIKKIFLRIYFELIIFSIFLTYLILLRISISIIGVNGGFVDWDFYALMGKDISSIFKGEIIEPYCYRPLMPFLAGLLPFNLEFNFALITFISIYLTGIMLYFTLRIKFDKWPSAFGLLIFCYFNHIGTSFAGSSFSLFNSFFFVVYMVDTLAFVFLIVCFYAILTSKKKLYLISLTLGVLTKEFVLFTIPVFLIYNIFEEGDSIKIKDIFKKKSIKKILNNSIFIIPSLTIYILLQIFIVPKSIYNYPFWVEVWHGYDGYSVEMWIYFLKLRIDEFVRGENIILYTFMTWGVIPLVLCLFNKRTEIFKWLKLYGIFMILVYSQLILLGGTRMLYVGFFPLIFLAVSGLNNPKVKYAFILIIFIEILFKYLFIRYSVIALPL